MRQEYVFPHKSLLFRIVVLYSVVIIVNLVAADIRGGSNGGATLAPADDFCFKMIYGYDYHCPFQYFAASAEAVTASQSARSRTK